MIAALRLTTGHPLPDATVIALVDPADRARLEELPSSSTRSRGGSSARRSGG